MSYDAIVIGAGANGLAAAATLKKAGRSVVVLERGAAPGGLHAGAEFAPGFRHAGILHDASCVRPAMLTALGLSLDLRDPPPVTVAGAAVGPATEGWASWRALVDRLRALSGEVFDAPPPDVRVHAPLWPLARLGLRVRRLGADDMLDLVRVTPMAVEDWLSEHFPDAAARGALAAPGLLGAWMGPRSPQSAGNLLMHELARGREPVGGSAALVRALAGGAGEIRTGADVVEIRVDGAVRGVRLATGETLDAPLVLHAAAPSRLRDLVAVLPESDDNDLRVVRSRGITAKLHLGVRGAPGPERRHVGDPVAMERAFDAVKYRTTGTPWLDVRVAGEAPSGHHVLSVLAHGVAADIDRDALRDRVVAALGGVDVVASEVLLPSDLEARFGLPGGHLLHGELALDQVLAWRPSVRLSRYATGIRGLYLASAGAHPAICPGSPGWLAARSAIGG